MFMVERNSNNPVLLPDKTLSWQARAVFNPSVVKDNDKYHMVYRAQSEQQAYKGHNISLSTIGYASSKDGIHFSDHQQLITPEEHWELFGCEDPRLTKINDTYYIFYTALSAYPFQANDIRIGVALTKNFKTIISKHLVTPFNSKAMVLLPEKINNQYVALLTVHTDLPPAKIAIARFDSIEQLWSEVYWQRWYANLDQHVIPLLRSSNDHLEVGAVPVKIKAGWLLIYSYIQNYFIPEKRIFGIEAVLLDKNDPAKVIAKTKQAILRPEKHYELEGDVANVIFPSSALLDKDTLSIYYGAADTTCCLATINVQNLMDTFMQPGNQGFSCSRCIAQGFLRYQDNPIINPRPEFAWEAKATFNPAAIYENGEFHIIYRALSYDDTSVFGYASSKNGLIIDERLPEPIYVPRESFEQKLRPGYSGCEDPRITKLDNRFYIFYTAFDGYTPRVAFTSIDIKDFLQKHWNWTLPIVITPPNIDDKDACLLSKKVDDKYVIFHRANDYIRINFVDSLNFPPGQYLEHSGYIIKPRKEYWDNKKFGIAAPPIEIKQGWLLFFHRVAADGNTYKVEALLLDTNNPTKVIAETDATLIEPEMDYEKENHVHNVVFPCGAILFDKEIFLYYGGADKVVAVAKMRLEDIIKRLGV